MGIRETVFSSKQEHSAFKKLKGTWSDKLNIYHNLPFLNIVDLSDAEERFGIWEMSLSKEEIEFLKHTSVDFVFCNKQDKALCCIEFDGMADGFSVGNTYTPRKGTKQISARAKKLGLKLKVAHALGLPFFVLGSTDFSVISPDSRLTIGDAIVGTVLTSNSIHSRLSDGFHPGMIGMTEAEFDSLSESDKQETISDWILNIEMESEFQNSMLEQEILKLRKQLRVWGGRIHFLHEEEHDRSIIKVGHTVSRNEVEATSTFQMPDIDDPHSDAPYSYIVTQIAEYLSLLKLKNSLEEKC